MSNGPSCERRKLFTRDTLLAYLLDHQARYPDKGDYHIELREHLLAAPGTPLQHDDVESVIILRGVSHR